MRIPARSRTPGDVPSVAGGSFPEPSRRPRLRVRPDDRARTCAWPDTRGQGHRLRHRLRHHLRPRPDPSAMPGRRGRTSASAAYDSTSRSSCAQLRSAIFIQMNESEIDQVHSAASGKSLHPPGRRHRSGHHNRLPGPRKHRAGRGLRPNDRKALYSVPSDSAISLLGKLSWSEPSSGLMIMQPFCPIRDLSRVLACGTSHRSRVRSRGGVNVHVIHQGQRHGIPHHPDRDCDLSLRHLLLRGDRGRPRPRPPVRAVAPSLHQNVVGAVFRGDGRIRLVARYIRPISWKQPLCYRSG